MKIHFIGIGGIGVSALAQYYLKKGHKVSGSDLVSSEITDLLKQKGAKLLLGEHKARNLPDDIDLVIYSPAIEKDNPELLEALKIKVKSYPEALGELTKKYFTIAVSGTHGKSTTTAMLGLALVKAGLDPTVIVGTKLKEFQNSNCRVGKSRYLVIEADEHFASFLNYWPKIIVLTNIDKEHLDYYNNLQNILKTFRKYISHLPKTGVLVANEDDKNILKVISNFKIQMSIPQNAGQNPNVKNYSLKQKEAEKIKKILKIPGTHNVYNALAVLETARVLGISDEKIFEALSQYRGAWRRFEESKLQITNYKLPITVISDYGHHPNEVKATLQAAREKYSDKKIWCVFQPHQYQRTYYLFKEFVDVFRKAKIDKIIITDIYSVAGRESDEIKKKVNSEKLVKKIGRKNVVYKKEDELIDYLKKNIGDVEVLIIMGAGDIYKLIAKLK